MDSSLEFNPHISSKTSDQGGVSQERSQWNGRDVSVETGTTGHEGKRLRNEIGDPQEKSRRRHVNGPGYASSVGRSLDSLLDTLDIYDADAANQLLEIVGAFARPGGNRSLGADDLELISKICQLGLEMGMSRFYPAELLQLAQFCKAISVDCDQVNQLLLAIADELTIVEAMVTPDKVFSADQLGRIGHAIAGKRYRNENDYERVRRGLGAVANLGISCINGFEPLGYFNLLPCFSTWQIDSPTLRHPVQEPVCAFLEAMMDSLRTVESLRKFTPKTLCGVCRALGCFARVFTEAQQEKVKRFMGIVLDHMEGHFQEYNMFDLSLIVDAMAKYSFPEGQQSKLEGMYCKIADKVDGLVDLSVFHSRDKSYSLLDLQMILSAFGHFRFSEASLLFIQKRLLKMAQKLAQRNFASLRAASLVSVALAMHKMNWDVKLIDKVGSFMNELGWRVVKDQQFFSSEQLEMVMRCFDLFRKNSKEWNSLYRELNGYLNLKQASHHIVEPRKTEEIVETPKPTDPQQASLPTSPQLQVIEASPCVDVEVNVGELAKQVFEKKDPDFAKKVAEEVLKRIEPVAFEEIIRLMDEVGTLLPGGRLVAKLLVHAAQYGEGYSGEKLCLALSKAARHLHEVRSQFDETEIPLIKQFVLRLAQEAVAHAHEMKPVQWRNLIRGVLCFESFGELEVPQILDCGEAIVDAMEAGWSQLQNKPQCVGDLVLLAKALGRFPIAPERLDQMKRILVKIVKKMDAVAPKNLLAESISYLTFLLYKYPIDSDVASRLLHSVANDFNQDVTKQNSYTPKQKMALAIAFNRYDVLLGNETIRRCLRSIGHSMSLLTLNLQDYARLAEILGRFGCS